MLSQVRRAGCGRQQRLEVSCAHTLVCAQLEEVERATALAEGDYTRFRIEKAELASRRSWNSSTRSQARAWRLRAVACRAGAEATAARRWRRSKPRSQQRRATAKPARSRRARGACAPRCPLTHVACGQLAWLTPRPAPARSAAAKLDNAITSQNESYLNNQTEQQALLLRHERPLRASFPCDARA